MYVIECMLEAHTLIGYECKYFSLDVPCVVFVVFSIYYV